MACYYMREKNGFPYPCGVCPACLVRRTDSWIFRLLQEDKVSSSVYWLRLSYDSYHLPRSPNNFPTLSKRDIQLFIKRLRKAHPPASRIKYFLCGEYGSRFHRPHYHLILFNADIELVVPAWVSPDTGLPIGEVYLDPRPFNAACAGYTIGYMFKRRGVALHDRDDRTREFLMMSKKLGLSYITPAVANWHKADISRNFVTLPSGNRIALPRYLSDKLHRPKPVNGVVCPVAKLAFDLYRDDRSALVDPQIAKRNKADLDAYIARHGNGDNYRVDLNQRRYWAIINFQNKAKGRIDV